MISYLSTSCSSFFTELQEGKKQQGIHLKRPQKYKPPDIKCLEKKKEKKKKEYKLVAIEVVKIQ